MFTTQTGITKFTKTVPAAPENGQMDVELLQQGVAAGRLVFRDPTMNSLAAAGESPFLALSFRNVV